MSGLPPEGEIEGGSEYIFCSARVFIAFRDELSQMHRLSRAFADHVLPGHKSGSAHVDSFIGAISMSKNKNRTFNVTLMSFQL